MVINYLLTYFKFRVTHPPINSYTTLRLLTVEFFSQREHLKQQSCLVYKPPSSAVIYSIFLLVLVVVSDVSAPPFHRGLNI